MYASELGEDGRADELNGRSVDSDDMSDGGSTEDLENGNIHAEQGSARAWWSVASERFPNVQVSSRSLFMLNSANRMCCSGAFLVQVPMFADAIYQH